MTYFLKKLFGLLVEQYLAFAQTMAMQQKPMYMNDWAERLDTIISMNGKELLINAGKISHKIALEKSSIEYEKYKKIQKDTQKQISLEELVKDIKALK